MVHAPPGTSLSAWPDGLAEPSVLPRVAERLARVARPERYVTQDRVTAAQRQDPAIQLLRCRPWVSPEIQELTRDDYQALGLLPPLPHSSTYDPSAVVLALLGRTGALAVLPRLGRGTQWEAWRLLRSMATSTMTDTLSRPEVAPELLRGAAMHAADEAVQVSGHTEPTERLRGIGRCLAARGLQVDPDGAAVIAGRIGRVVDSWAGGVTTMYGADSAALRAALEIPGAATPELWALLRGRARRLPKLHAALLAVADAPRLAELLVEMQDPEGGYAPAVLARVLHDLEGAQRERLAALPGAALWPMLTTGAEPLAGWTVQLVLERGTCPWTRAQIGTLLARATARTTRTALLRLAAVSGDPAERCAPPRDPGHAARPSLS